MGTLAGGRKGDIREGARKSLKANVGLGGVTYAERCKEAGINTLERRRYRTYKTCPKHSK